jgi:hypothetical protein
MRRRGLYKDKQDVTHEIRIIREHDLPGFYVCRNQDDQQLVIHRSDIRLCQRTKKKKS